MFQQTVSRPKTVTLVLVLVALMAPLLLAAPAQASPALDAEEALFCTLINNHRAANGLPPVKLSPRLTNAAAWMSSDMAANNYVSHTDSLGRNFIARLAAFGYTSSQNAENLTAGMPDAVNAFLAWKNSSGHNANMLRATSKVMGIGRAFDATSRYKWYWTADFGATEDSGTVACPSAPLALPTILVNDVAQNEGTNGTPTSSFTFTLTLSHPTVEPVSVWYTTHDITATGGVDYVPTAAKITIPPGEVIAWFHIPVYKDSVPEPDETFWVLLSNAENGVIGGTGLGKGTILNDDGPMVPTVLINDVSVVEGTGPGTTNATFTLTLSHATNVAASVWYTTHDNTATGGSDYVPTAKKAIFPAGSTTLDISIPIIRDNVPEPDETFWVLLSVPENLIIGGTAVGKATILNDDGPMVPTVLINDVSVVEGTGPGTTNATFTLSLSHATTVAASVWYTTYDNTATGGSDYVPTAKKAIFPAGSTSLDISIPIVRDNVPEPDETFWVLLSVPENLIIGGTAVGQATIVDDD